VECGKRHWGNIEKGERGKGKGEDCGNGERERQGNREQGTGNGFSRHLIPRAPWRSHGPEGSSERHPTLVPGTEANVEAGWLDPSVPLLSVGVPRDEVMWRDRAR
jgi:hypothetical protein